MFNPATILAVAVPLEQYRHPRISVCAGTVRTRWTIASAGLAGAGFAAAAAWMVWVVSQGTNQEIEPGWSALRYSAPLLGALVSSVAAFVTVMVSPEPKRKASIAIGAVAGLESVLFGLVWAGLVAAFPFPA